MLKVAKVLRVQDKSPRGELSILKLLINRDFILLLAIAAGFAAGETIAGWLEPAITPALAMVMTLSIATITSQDLIAIKDRPGTIITSIVLSYVLMGGLIILLGHLLTSDTELRAGFVIAGAVPPAIAVVPFTYLLSGNTVFSLAGLISTYLAALVLTPLIMLLFLDVGFFNPLDLLIVLAELVILPLVLSRILRHTPLIGSIHRWRGAVINWSFFLVVFTIIGLNRDAFLGDPLDILKISAVGISITFLLGYVLEMVARLRHVDQATVTSWIIFATNKNYGLSSVIALALFTEKAAVPGAVCLVFAVLHIIWRSFQKTRRDKLQAKSG